MKAIIVAAGVGSRLGELTKELPKPLIDINGKSIIERQILLFQKFGITKIIITIHYLARTNRNEIFLPVPCRRRLRLLSP